MTLALQAAGITKRFSGVLAVDHVDFELEPGEIHALLGENGAGKTTLMNVLYGLVQADAGAVYLDGQRADVRSPRDAIARGIGMVHQHFTLVPPLTVAENVVLGQECLTPATRRLGPLALLDRRRARRQVGELSAAFGLAVDPNARVQDLSVGAQQRVEIVKALYRQARIVILDEPTAVLTPQEADELFVIMRSLARQGKSLIFITHKLREVFAVADRISVMRAGRMVGTTTPRQTSEPALAEMMVGRGVLREGAPAPSAPGASVLQVEGLRVQDDRRQVAVDGITLAVRAGEVLGIAGVQGNGQSELVEALAGLRRAADGRILVLGHDMTQRSARAMVAAGTAYVPEDRQRDGLILTYSVRDNLILRAYYTAPFARGAVLDWGAIDAHATALVEQYDIRAPGILAPVGSLSGGNQQKIVVAGELSRPIKLLVAAHPTRGLDVGSTAFIHRRLLALRDDGVAIVLVSAELDELIACADRIAAMYRGRIVAIVPARDATREQLGLWMAGITEAAPAPRDGGFHED